MKFMKPSLLILCLWANFAQAAAEAMDVDKEGEYAEVFIDSLGFLAPLVDHHTSSSELEALRRVRIDGQSLYETLTMLAKNKQVTQIAILDGLGEHDELPTLPHVTSLTIMRLTGINNFAEYLKVFPNLQELHIVYPIFSRRFVYKTYAMYSPNYEKLQAKAIDEAHKALIDQFLKILKPYVAKGILKTFSVDETIGDHRYFERSLQSGRLSAFKGITKFELAEGEASTPFTLTLFERKSYQ